MSPGLIEGRCDVITPRVPLQAEPSCGFAFPAFVTATTDARGTGFPRIQNGTVDIGSFETTPVPLTASWTALDPLGPTDRQILRYDLAFTGEPEGPLTRDDLVLQGDLATSASAMPPARATPPPGLPKY
jgi:hypothetical protein